MESDENESTHQHPKHINHSQNPSTSMQDSTFTLPVLPPELITEILTRVPVKSLVKFRCVSKSWLALISSHEFIKNHLSVSADNKECTHHRLMMRLDRPNNNLKDCSFSSLLSNESFVEAFDLDYPMRNSGVSLKIVGSVNGLICLAARTTGDLFLWNPAIKKYKQLSSIPPTLQSNSYFIYGFGYDEFHDDYKVFAVYQHGSLSVVEVKIYCLKSDSWRNMDVFEDNMSLVNSGTFLNGKLHWTASSYLGKHSVRGTWSIVSIDMAEEKWGEVEPPCFGEEDYGFRLRVLGNNLSVLSTNIRLTRVNMWVMEEYGVTESWKKMYTIKYPNDLESYFLSPYCYMSNKGEILLVFEAPRMMQNQDDTPSVIRKIYDPKDYSIRYAELTNFGPGFSKEIYIESLVCPLSQNQPRINQQ